MPQPNFIIFYVDNPLISADFYAGLLSRLPVEAAPTFAMFALYSGVMLGLWSRHTVQPCAQAAVGGAELAFTVHTPMEVDDCHRDWQNRGLPMIQPPTDMDFGRSFVALDPDGHRLRVFAAAA